MQVIIPLAGKGTRLLPHTHTRAKPLCYLAGKPVLGHILDSMKKLPVEEIIFITGHLGSQIKEYVDSNYKFKTRYLEQEELNGQSPAVLLAKPFINKDVVIWFVDTISNADLSQLGKLKADGLIFVKDVDDPRRFGQVHTNAEGIVDRIIEKADPPVSNLVNIGLYYVKDSKKLFTAIEEQVKKKVQTKGEYYLIDAFQIMIDQGAQFRAESVDVWEDCGKPETLLATNRYLLEETHGNKPVKAQGCIIVPPVFIDPSAKVENSIIGPFVSVAPGATITNSIIRDSIIHERASVTDTTLESSIIGDNAIVVGRLRQLNVGDSSEVAY